MNLGTATQSIPDDGGEKLLHTFKTLCEEASLRFGLSREAVLEASAALYEKALISYPRSDCSFLPWSKMGEMSDLANNIRSVVRDGTLRIGEPRPDVFQADEAIGHHAIIPTSLPASVVYLLQSTFTVEMMQVYGLVHKRWLDATFQQ